MTTIQFAAFLFAIIGAFSITLLFKLNAIWVILRRDVGSRVSTPALEDQLNEISKLMFPLGLVVFWSAVGLVICLGELFL